MGNKTQSIMVDSSYCVVCGSPNIEWHHVFFGTSNRAVSEKYGLKIPLCKKHHTGDSDCPHKHHVIDLCLKYWGQSVYERELGTRDDFRVDFGKSYL